MAQWQMRRTNIECDICTHAVDKLTSNTKRTVSKHSFITTSNAINSILNRIDIRHISIANRRMEKTANALHIWIFQVILLRLANTFVGDVLWANRNRTPTTAVSNHKSILAISIIPWTFNLWCRTLAVSGVLCASAWIESWAKYTLM